MRIIGRVLGAAAAVGCLGWVLHDVDRAAFFQGIQRIQWGWAALGIGFDILSYVSQGWRWRLLMAEEGRLSTLQATRAIYAGLFTNEVMPLRLGEVVRAYLAARWSGASIKAMIPSMAVERLMDGAWLAAGVAASAAFVALPKAVRQGAWMVAGIVAVGLMAGAWIVKRRKWAANRLSRALEETSEQLCAAWRTGRLVSSFLVSGILLGGQVLAFWAILQACNLPYGIPAATVVLLIVHLGTAVPNAPANVGSYQLLVVAGLTMLGTDKATAGVFSIVVFVLLTIPLWLLGYLAIRASGATFSQLRREVTAAIA